MKTYLEFDADGFPSVKVTNAAAGIELSDTEAKKVRAAIERGHEVRRNGQSFTVLQAPVVRNSPALTAQEKDDLADRVATQELENNPRVKAMGLVMADVIERVFGISHAAAWNQVQTRYRQHYRGLL